MGDQTVKKILQSNGNLFAAKRSKEMLINKLELLQLSKDRVKWKEKLEEVMVQIGN